MSPASLLLHCVRVLHCVRAGRAARLCALCVLALFTVMPRMVTADTVFLYSSASTIRGLNLTQSSEQLLTTSPLTSSVNGLAMNTDAGIVYYGSGTSVYRWDPALGSGASSHALINDFSSAPLTAPISNINSAGGSYVDGIYYVGSENANGYIEEIYAVTTSSDGQQFLSINALDLLDACNCTSVQLGGFGDIAAVLENGEPVVYGSSADISGNGSGTSAGYWKLNTVSGIWTFLNTGAGGQLSNSLDGRLYSNSGTNVQELNKTTGALGATLMTVQNAIWDFSGGLLYDFGDAGAEFGAAMHRLPAQQSASVYLGANPPDNEAGALNAQSGAQDALGDDTSGIDDEDGVGSLTPISADATQYSLSVACTTGATVAGWIDFNGNGLFDTNERNDAHPRICLASNVSLSWSSITPLATGLTTLRLRTSSQASAIAQPTGLAPDGEAEDHPLTIEGNVAGSCAAGDVLSVYSANDLPQSIGPDAGSITTSTITVSEPGIVTDVNVLDVQGTHTYINDLQFVLTHESASTVLYGRACGSQNNFDFGFDDEATGTPPCPPVDGDLYPPSQSLSTFHGSDLAGDWSLSISDAFNQDGGSLVGWSVQVCSTPPVVENPELRLGKSMRVEGQSAIVTLVAENVGNVDLSDVQIVDNLDDVFGAGRYSLDQSPELLAAPSGVQIDNNYTGAATNQALLAAGAALAPGERLTLRFTVNVASFASDNPSGQFSNQANATGASPLGTIAEDDSGNGLDLGVDNDEPFNIIMDARRSLTGRVFIDSSATQTTSHDGLMQSNERGVAAMQVEIYSVSSGQLLTTAVTTGDGHWQVWIDSAYNAESLDVRLVPTATHIVISEAPSHADADVSDGQLHVSTSDGSDSTGLDFGLLRLPTLTQPQSVSVPAGTVYQLAHVFTASSYGDVSFGLQPTSSPDSTMADARLINDIDCDQNVDANESAVSATLSMAPDEQLCLIVDGFVPATAPPGQVGNLLLEATFLFADIAGTDVSVQSVQSNNDVVQVIAGGSGRLVLEKTVSNISLGESESTSNAALPGHILEYRIRYTNQGTGPLSDLSINDSPPAFTQIQSGSVLCGSVLQGMSCTSTSSTSQVQWQFTGNLPPGSAGAVSYRVQID